MAPADHLDTRDALEHREIEWQFEAVDLRPVQRWLATRGPDASPSVGPGPVREHVDTYWDTDDWRLYRAGWSLRTRDRGDQVEATMKSRAGATGHGRDRREITEALPNNHPATLASVRGPVGERIRALAGRKPLTRVLEIRTRRRALPVVIDGGQVAELALDDTSVPVPSDDRPVRLQRVEIEVTGEGDTELLGGFVEELRTACGLTPAAGPKFEVGLLATGQGPPPPPDLGPTEVDDTETVGEVAFAVLRQQFAAFLVHEPGARLGEDPEEVHDMRVAIRRMRAAIRLFGEALPVRVQSLSRELKWVADALGEVRDLDVQLEQVAEWSEELPEHERGALERVGRIFGDRHARARRDLLRVLDSRRFDRLVAGMTGLLQRGPLRRSPHSRRPVLLAGPEVVRRARRKVKRRGDAIGEASSPEDLHRLRIAGKRLRYAVEFLEPLYGRPARRLAKRLSALQDVLGLHQDAQVAIAHLRELVRDEGEHLPPAAIFALGRVAERFRAQAEEQRGLLDRAYARVRGRTWRALRRRMDSGREGAEAAVHQRGEPRRPAIHRRDETAASSAVPA